MSHKISLLTLTLLLSLPSFAQQKQKLSLESATVYLSAAELTSSAKLNLPQGETEVVFTNVAGNIQKPTLQVSTTNGVVVESAEIKNDYLQDDNLSPAAKAIKDSIDFVQKQTQAIKTKSTVLDDEVNLLKENSKIGGTTTGVTVIDLQKMMDYVSAKMNELLNEKAALQNLLTLLDEKNKKLEEQLKEEQQKQFTPGGQLVVKFYTPQATSTDVSIQYVVPNAGWTPSYDVHADKANNHVSIVFKASIFQNCGIRWDNIKLTLSTGNPSEGAQEPTLNPLYLSFRQQHTLDEVVVVGYGTKKFNNNGELGRADTATIPTMSNYVNVDNSGISTTYNIDLNYSIPSDGQTHLVPVKDYKVPADYRYVSIPKLDEDAFLEARITKWEDLNLLPAQTNVFYDGAFVGNGYLDTKNITGTLTISFGRDKKIIIKREQNKDFSAVKFLGSNTRKQVGYNISIRNTRTEAIDIVVKDQFPVSTDKDIEVSDQLADGATINNDTGAVEWALHILPNETKKVSISYTVKYPKDKVVQGL